MRRAAAGMSRPFTTQASHMPDRSHFNDWIHGPFGCAAATSGAATGILPMDISSVTSSVPVSQTAMDNSKSSDSNSASSYNIASAYEPPSPPPLPPGQGVRVDQLA
jgi:hypothetical protein